MRVQIPFKCPTIGCNGVLIYSATHDLECQNADKCGFGISHSRIGKKKSFFNIRVDDENINPTLLKKVFDGIPHLRKMNRPLAIDKVVKTETKRSRMQILASQYGIAPEDIYSIKYSTETLKGLAEYYHLTIKDIRRIKVADIED